MTGKAHALTLEIGCGDGRLLGRLRQRGERVIGVEPGLEAIARGGGNASIHGRLVAADALQLPFADGTFDQAIFGWSL
jgi:SAM-dependent methyltransferase